MANKKGSSDASQGKPSLDFLGYLQGIFTATFITRLTTKTVYVVKTSITADATAGVVVDIPLNARIIDMWAIAKATNGSGSVTLKDGAASPVTLATAIAMATDGALARLAAGLTASLSQVVATQGIKLFANGAGDRGDVYITYTPS